jgi:two-component system, chemotaxis family, sensor kinase CheA
LTGSAAATEDNFFLPGEFEEIRRAFFDQGREALDELDQGLLLLENQLPTPERLRALRRPAHTLKSDFATVGFPLLSTLSHALEDALTQLERRGTVVTASDTDRLLGAVDALRNGLQRGMRGESEPDVTGWLVTLNEQDGFGEIERALLAGRQRGLHALRVTIAWSGRRRAAPLVERVVAHLGLDVLARRPLAAEEGEHALRLDTLTRDGLATLTTRVKALKGVRVSLEEWTASAPTAAPSPEPAVVDAPNEATQEGETIRIESSRVDEVLTLVGEMVIARSAIAGLATELEPWLPRDECTRLSDAVATLGRVLQDLQRGTMRMRMVPAERVFRRFSRAVRDLRQRTGKQFVLHVEGQQTELDRGILDALEEPLLHLVRNAADHGIESPAERIAAGKPAEGRIALRASREGNQVLIEVADDGRGIDPHSVRAGAVRKGLLSAESAAELTESEVMQLVFMPGLSTAAEVTETSGRGIGLDVVRETVESLKGSVLIVGTPGQGACVTIRVPLTVAIIRALLFRAGGRELAVPLGSVVEIARYEDLTIQRLGERVLFRRRDEVLSIVRPADVLGVPAAESANGFVLVVQCSAGRFGLLVDELAGEHELVIKAVHDRWIRTPLVAGAAVLPGGGLVLILDAAAVYRAGVGGPR